MYKISGRTTAKIILLKKGMNEIRTEFKDSLSEDTNTSITISSADRSVRKLANEINQQLSELKAQKCKYLNGDRELKEAVSNISHDLRTPLTTIIGYIDLLERTEQTADSRQYIEQIRGRSEALNLLIEELFLYSIVTSTPDLSYEKVNVCCVLEETLISFYASMQNAGITPQIEMPSAPVYRILDPTALSRIFNNIVNNAVKYSNGNFKVTMTEDASITFSNSSSELSPVAVAKLFDRFYTVDSARKSTGIGLSIAKILTERMNGTISAQYSDNRLYITVSFKSS